MILGAEIALFVMGVIALFCGRLPLTSTRIVRGAAARLLGLVAMAIVPLTVLVFFAVAATFRPQFARLTEDQIRWFAIGVEGGVVLLCMAFIYAVGWPLASTRKSSVAWETYTERPQAAAAWEDPAAPLQRRGGPGLGRLGTLVVIAVIVGGGVWRALPKSSLSPDRFAAVKVGMTEAEVEAVLGAPPGDYSSGGLTTFTVMNHPNNKSWLGPEQGITVFFDNVGRVVDKTTYSVQRPRATP